MLRLLLLLPLLVALGPPRMPAAEPPPVQSGRFVQSELADWLQGTLAGVYVEGGDLRLQPEQITGSYVSPPVQAPFGFNGAVLQWHAAVTTAQTLTLELRSSLDGQSWTGWQRAVPSTASDGGLLSQVFV